MKDIPNTFPSSLRLRKSKEFTRIWKMGCKLHTPHFILLVEKKNSLHSRLGITVSRKVGNAVCRNRVKRLLREYFRKNQAFFKESVDLSVVAKRNAAEITHQEIAAELKCLRDNG